MVDASGNPNWFSFRRNPSLRNKGRLIRGGEGTRLRPLTEGKSKALVEVNGTTLILDVENRFLLALADILAALSEDFVADGLAVCDGWPIAYWPATS